MRSKWAIRTGIMESVNHDFAKVENESENKPRAFPFINAYCNKAHLHPAVRVIACYLQ